MPNESFLPPQGNLKLHYHYLVGEVVRFVEDRGFFRKGVPLRSKDRDLLIFLLFRNAGLINLPCSISKPMYHTPLRLFALTMISNLNKFLDIFRGALQRHCLGFPVSTFD